MLIMLLLVTSSFWWDSPLHRTGNTLKVFCLAAVGKICTLLTNPQIVDEADENLFNSIRYNPSHLLHQLLPRSHTHPQISALAQDK